MPCEKFYCGYWVIERQLADLRQIFEHVGSYTSGFSSGFCWASWPIYVGFFGRVFGRVGPIYVGFWLGYRGFWAGFSWFFFFFGL